MKQVNLLTTPVVFIIYNRPGLTERVLKVIEQAAPAKLFVIADGPKAGDPSDARKCAETRAIIEKIRGGSCELITNYSESNLGCRKRVSSGIAWVFSQVEEAIILEDDCLPSASFFYFCQSLLSYYRFENRIMHIGGDNFQPKVERTQYSYFFSKYNHIWGWATWRRAWKYYDVDMNSWPVLKKTGRILSVCNDKYERAYWTDRFDRTFNQQIDTWDCQWVYACWSCGGLSVYPSVNLVSNIGCGIDSSHTKKNDGMGNLPTGDIWELKHPPAIVQNKKADLHTFDYVFGGRHMKKAGSLWSKGKRCLQRLGVI